jgi:hypothetical protein
MDIGTRKLSFVREFLRISDEELIVKLEQLLRSERNKRISKELSSLTMDEFNKMIDESEEDFINGRVTEARDLLKRVESWK